MTRRAISAAAQAHVVARARDVLINHNFPRGLAPAHRDRTVLGLISVLTSLLSSNVSNAEPLNAEACAILTEATKTPSLELAQAASASLLRDIVEEMLPRFARYAEAYAEFLDLWKQSSDAERAQYDNDIRVLIRATRSGQSDEQRQVGRLNDALLAISGCIEDGSARRAARLARKERLP